MEYQGQSDLLSVLWFSFSKQGLRLNQNLLQIATVIMQP